MAIFLHGNDDEASIAPNLVDHPGMDAFRRVFGAIGQREDVHGVWAMLQLEYDEYPGEEWPFAASLYVVTSASVDEVQAWVAELEPDPSEEVSLENVPAGIHVPAGCRVVLVWWD